VGVRSLESQTFLLLLVAVSVGLAWVIWPYYGAVFWGGIAAIVFAPVYRRLAKLMQPRDNLAALTTLLLILTIVILPLAMIALSLLQQLYDLYASVRSGELDIPKHVQSLADALPQWAIRLLSHFGVTNLDTLREKLNAESTMVAQVLAGHALNIGQSMFSFVVNLGVMLYLLFFLLRDGEALAIRIRDAVPLRVEHRIALFNRFTVVVRATVKGDVLVAALQGALGGLIFWFLNIRAPMLWAVVMTFLSLLPAIGAAIVWFPVAVYLLVTGAIWEGVLLFAYGTFVIGLVDNILRPVLVGKDAKMPGYVVLISTLGGIELFGLNGFVIGPVTAAMFIATWDIFAAARRATGRGGVAPQLPQSSGQGQS
jgi:predicted PurR-regulated permease PerM